jgi:hypothetical protein
LLAGDAAGLVSFDLSSALLASFLSSATLALSSGLLVFPLLGEALGEATGLEVGAAVGLGVAEFGVVVVVFVAPPPQAPITKLIAATNAAKNIGLLISLDLLSKTLPHYAATIIPERPRPARRR